MPPDPDVAAAVRLLHRRQAWIRTAVTSFFAFLLSYGAYDSGESQGASAPSWFLDMVIAFGALTVLGIIAAVVCNARLLRLPPAVRAQAAPILARHPDRRRAHHYPPLDRLVWAVAWVGFLLILVVAVVSVPAAVDGAAYLAGAERTATFDPVSYQTNCDRYSCGTITDGVLKTGGGAGAGVSASWQNVVPLGRPFQVREPLWRWGLGLSLIDSSKTALIALIISLMIEAWAVLIVVKVVRLARDGTGTGSSEQRQRPSRSPARSGARRVFFRADPDDAVVESSALRHRERRVTGEGDVPCGARAAEVGGAALCLVEFRMPAGAAQTWLGTQLQPYGVRRPLRSGPGDGREGLPAAGCAGGRAIVAARLRGATRHRAPLSGCTVRPRRTR